MPRAGVEPYPARDGLDIHLFAQLINHPVDVIGVYRALVAVTQELADHCCIHLALDQ